MQTFTITGTDDTPLQAYSWHPQQAASAIVIIIHGMAEHARRYNAFAQELAAAGLAVHALDLRGHGATTGHTDHGHLGNDVNWQTLLDDVAALRARAVETSGELPVILFGHSLGSFIARGVIQTRGGDYAAAILSGTGTPSRMLCRIGALVAALEEARVEATGRSALLRAMSFGAYEKAIKRRTGSKRTRFDWLSSQPEAVAAYIDDPETGFDMSTAAWQCLLPGIARIQTPHARRGTPEHLPLLIVSGSNDPVGNFGSDPHSLAAAYKNDGQTDVTTRIYTNARHELIHDTTATQLTRDMLAWLATRGYLTARTTHSSCEMQ